MEIKRKDDIVYNRKENRGKETIPSKEQYIQTLNNLATSRNFEAYKVLRLIHEMGLSRQDVVNLETSNIDRYHKRGLWVAVSKRVNRGSRTNPKYEMRTREIPMNQNLYAYLMANVDMNFKYILKKNKGDVNSHYTVQRVDELFRDNSVPWSPHKGRHYFRTQMKKWMRENRQFDEEVIDALMGHKPREAREMYGVIDWDYKLAIIDKVFG